jgi:hypothetical protein
MDVRISHTFIRTIRLCSILTSTGLEGHIREQNYGADWGDYVSFVKHMRQKASHLDVDLLVVDTGVSSPCHVSLI